MVKLVVSNVTKTLNSQTHWRARWKPYIHIPWHHTWLGVFNAYNLPVKSLVVFLRGWERNEKNLYKLQLVRPTKWGMPQSWTPALGSSFGSGALIWGNASLLGPLTLHLSQWRNAPAAARLGLLVLLDPFWFESSFTNCIIEYWITRVKLASTHCGRIWP